MDTDERQWVCEDRSGVVDFPRRNKCRKAGGKLNIPASRVGERGVEQRTNINLGYLLRRRPGSPKSRLRTKRPPRLPPVPSAR